MFHKRFLFSQFSMLMGLFFIHASATAGGVGCIITGDVQDLEDSLSSANTDVIWQKAIQLSAHAREIVKGKILEREIGVNKAAIAVTHLNQIAAACDLIERASLDQISIFVEGIAGSRNEFLRLYFDSKNSTSLESSF